MSKTIRMYVIAVLFSLLVMPYQSFTKDASATMTDTPFIAQCRKGIGILEALAKGADVNERGNKGHTPIIAFFDYIKNQGYAIDDIAVVRAMIDKGADLSVTDEDGYSVLHHAVEAFDNVKDPDKAYAGSQEMAEIIDLLVHNGAKVEAADKEGRTPLIYSLDCSTVDRVRMKLVDLSEDIDATAFDGSTALMHAARSGCFEITIDCINEGADVNVRDYYRNTPLIWACTGKHRSVDVMNFLIEKGADVNAVNITTRTALMEYLASPDEAGPAQNIEIVRLLLAAGANLAITDVSGRTAMNIAASMHNDVFETSYEPNITKLDDKTFFLSSRGKDLEFSWILDMKKKGNRLYVFYGWGWIVLDLSKLPDFIFVTDYYCDYGSYYATLGRFEITGDYLYTIGGYDAMLRVFSIKDEKKPMELAKIDVNKCDVLQDARSLIAIGNYLFLSIRECYWFNNTSCQSENRVISYDISDRKNPKRVGEIQIEYGDIGAMGEFLVVHGMDPVKKKSTLSFYKMKTKPEPVLVVETGVPENVIWDIDMCIDGSRVFIPYSSGLRVYDIRINKSNLPEITRQTEMTKPSNGKTSKYELKSIIVKNNIIYGDWGFFEGIGDNAGLEVVKPRSNQDDTSVRGFCDFGDYIIGYWPEEVIRVFDARRRLEPVCVRYFIRRMDYYPVFLW